MAPAPLVNFNPRPHISVRIALKYARVPIKAEFGIFPFLYCISGALVTARPPKRSSGLFAHTHTHTRALYALPDTCAEKKSQPSCGGGVGAICRSPPPTMGAAICRFDTHHTYTLQTKKLRIQIMMIISHKTPKSNQELSKNIYF